MSENTYSLQVAKTGRAKCRVCKEPIDKDALKIVTELPQRENQDYAMSYSHHVHCFKLPRGLAAVSIEDFVEDYLTDGGDDSTGPLFPDKKVEVIALLEEAAVKKKGSKGKPKGGDAGGEQTILMRVQAAVKAQEVEEKEPPKKKVKKENGGKNDGDDEVQAMVPIYKKHHKKKTEELKDILRWNKQLLKGTKDFVLFKVVDGELHGRLGFCPLCQGNLKLNEDDLENVHCGGRYDEDTGTIQLCSFTAPRAGKKAAPRLVPFFLEEPSEEEKEAMETERAKIRGEQEGDLKYEDNQTAMELLNQAAGMKIDLQNKDGIQKAANAFLDLVKGKVDLPENRNSKMEVGRLMMSNNDKTPKEIMMAIFDKYGFVEAKAENAKTKVAAVQASCANPANAALILAFRECSGYYMKEGNRNAGSTYVKAIQTLTDLEEEVTAENAMSFSKGKTKLPNIGKGTAEKMKEFCETGTFSKLEEKRAAHA
ncbi:helix-hairpin-helix domain containing protein [Nitzschia inconspicua]|uniref:Helix-hairpin-helix domain containing protein n=1 Tax=Nitzschia inconspicua TaxID=303405 RepID=A0A9K3L3Q2_9STRA|nr:helix-hairpin-helix domain containing protein [Nitzschia inconspicua]